MNKENFLGDAIDGVSPNAVNVALEKFEQDYDLFAVQNLIDDEGQPMTVKARKDDNWTSELQLIFDLLVAARNQAIVEEAATFDMFADCPADFGKPINIDGKVKALKKKAQGQQSLFGDML